jgi:hypothetical protein
LAGGAALMFEQYQTFFVGLIGFGGVIVTLIWNSHSQRKLQERMRIHDKQVLIKSLLAELRAAQGVLEYEIALLKHDKDPDLIVRTYKDYSVVYMSSLARLGLLHEALAEPVVLAHFLLREMPDELQRALGKNCRLSYGYLVEPGSRPAIKRILGRVQKGVMEAINALQQEKR